MGMKDENGRVIDDGGGELPPNGAREVSF